MDEQTTSTVNKAVIVGVVSFIGGLTLGYFLGKRDGKTVVVPASDPVPQADPNQGTLFEETVEVTTTTTTTVITEVDPVLEALLEEEAEIERRQAVELGSAYSEQSEEPAVINVFRRPDDQWVYEDELQVRNPDRPYVIHVDEFIPDEMGFKQETVTYYAGDDVMVDSHNTPIYNYAGMMGPLKFGHGSNSPEIVYIRNEPLQMEWEVLRTDEAYSISVMGLHVDEDELRHAYAVPKMRRER